MLLLPVEISFSLPLLFSFSVLHLCSLCVQVALASRHIRRRRTLDLLFDIQLLEEERRGRERGRRCVRERDVESVRGRDCICARERGKIKEREGVNRRKKV